jgi:hypothetical protein
MDILLGIAAAALLAAVFLFLYISFFRRAPASSVQPAAAAIPEGKQGEAQICPICAARIDRGDAVKSKVFPPSGRSGRLLHILGCKYCRKGERRRSCPICGAELSPDDYLVGRIWRLPGKPQVQIQGCVKCIVTGRRVKAARLR